MPKFETEDRITPKVVKPPVPPIVTSTRMLGQNLSGVGSFLRSGLPIVASALGLGNTSVTGGRTPGYTTVLPKSSTPTPVRAVLPVTPTTPVSGTKYIPSQTQMRSRSFNPQQPTNTAWQAQPPTHPGDLGNQYLQGGRGFYIPNWVQVSPGKFVLYGSKNTQTGAVFNPPDVSLTGNVGGDSGGGGGGGGGGWGGGNDGGSYFSMGLVNWRI